MIHVAWDRSDVGYASHATQPDGKTHYRDRIFARDGGFRGPGSYPHRNMPEDYGEKYSRLNLPLHLFIRSESCDSIVRARREERKKDASVALAWRVSRLSLCKTQIRDRFAACTQFPSYAFFSHFCCQNIHCGTFTIFSHLGLGLPIRQEKRQGGQA